MGYIKAIKLYIGGRYKVVRCNKQPLMKAKFEEKTFESYFNSELDRKSDIYFPPGQVLEGSLGFDASALTRNRRIWRRLGYPFWFHPQFRGVDLREIADEMEHILNIELENIPQMKANILFQYKRSEYIKSPKGTEWPHWNQPYFRYDIYTEQQNLLSHIHARFGANVLVIYAAPCTHDINELIAHRRDIINNSNFTKAVDLNGHHRNTYVSAGTHSIACSEPSRIESINILETIEKFNYSEINDTESKNIKNFLLDFSSKVQSIISEDEYFADSFRDLNKEIEKVKQFELFHSLLTMNNFRKITGTQWLVKI